MSPTAKTFSLKVVSQGVVQGLVVLRGLIALPILSRTLGVEAYGIWTQIMVTLSLMAPILMLRFDTVFVRYFSTDQAHERWRQIFSSMFFFIIGIVALVSAVLCVFNRTAAFLVFRDSDLAAYIPVLAGLLAFRALFLFFLSTFRARYQIGLYSAVQALQLLGEAVILFMMVVVFSRPLLETLQAVLWFNALAGVILILAVLSRTGLMRPRLRLLKPYVRFALPLVPNVSLFWIINYSDRYIITHLIDLEHAGIYAASYALGQFVILLLAPLTFVLYPTLSRLWEAGERENALLWMRQSIKVFLFLAVPAAAGLHRFSFFLLNHLATDAFEQPWLVLLVAAGFLFHGVSQILIYVLHMEEKSFHVLYLFLAVAVSNIAMNLMLIPRLGIQGAGLATLFSYVIEWILLILIVRRSFHPVVDKRPVLTVLAGTGVMTGALYLVPIGTPLQAAGLMAGGAVIYLACTRIMGGWGKKEWSLFRDVIRYPLERKKSGL